MDRLHMDCWQWCDARRAGRVFWMKQYVQLRDSSTCLWIFGIDVSPFRVNLLKAVPGAVIVLCVTSSEPRPPP